MQELRTELSTMKRRLNAYESGTASLGGQSDALPEGVSISSRASSVTSLEAVTGQRSSTDASSPVTAGVGTSSSTGDSGFNGVEVNCMQYLSIVRIFRTVNQKSIEYPSVECRALSKSRIIELSIINLYVFNPFLVYVPQRYLFTNAHLKFWGYGTFYNTLFTVREIMSIHIFTNFFG